MEPSRLVDRNALIRMLAGDALARSACRQALAAGDRYVVWGSLSPARVLAKVYARREQRCRRDGIRTLDLGGAVARLQSLGDTMLAFGSVHAASPPRTFFVFLDANLDRVVACSAMDLATAELPGRR